MNAIVMNGAFIVQPMLCTFSRKIIVRKANSCPVSGAITPAIGNGMSFS